MARAPTRRRTDAPPERGCDLSDRNALRQPAFKGIAHRAPAAGLPNADRVMERGLILPSNHSLTDDDLNYIWTTAETALA